MRKDERTADESAGVFQSTSSESAGSKPVGDSIANATPPPVGTFIRDRSRSCTETSHEHSELPAMLGRFPIRRRLGAGSFGTVYEAFDDRMQRSVAIKVPSPQLVASSRAREQFLQEARSVARLRHEAIVAAYDFADGPGDQCFIVYEFVAGSTLADRLKSHPMGHVEATGIVAQIADALHHAHQHGLIHRDIKPANILMDDRGRPRVADFGLAVHEDELSAFRGTQTGTRPYMAPEQVRGEGHRIDGRTDVYSLGVVLYELLTGRTPFSADSAVDLFDQILHREPKPPRQYNDEIPRELERVCLRAMSKRISDRYTTAKDMADDLRLTLGCDPHKTPTGDGQAAAMPDRVDSADPDQRIPPSHAAGESSDRPIHVIPRGLRAFGPDDQDFFLELLPGVRDRSGLPESIRFWKSRVERASGDATFAVGLLYGPSGCGKSSLIRAGILPHLNRQIASLYVECTRDDTVRCLERAIDKLVPGRNGTARLSEQIAEIRRNGGLPDGRKLLVVLDQFEQWLHAEVERAPDSDLLSALRHCDGTHVQAIVTVRDDFWLGISRLFQLLEIRLIEDDNCRLVDLFDLDHARRVLRLFGQAYGRLPARLSQFSPEQHRFLEEAVAGLAEQGHIVSVRLSLFAEMMKSRDWTAEGLRGLGGTSGVGLRFLDETFSSRTANPAYRAQEKYARAVLEALLPETGSDIKGRMRSRQELSVASGLANQARQFDDLIEMLDRDLHLITPTETNAADGSTAAAFYQLTHDYLVPSLREWLSAKRRQSWRGRAAICLEERASQWGRSRQPRFLPSPLEFTLILASNTRWTWTGAQRQMIRAATKRYGTWTLLCCVIALLLGWSGWQALGRLHAHSLIRSIRTASIDQVPRLVAQLEPYRRWTVDSLTELREGAHDSDTQLRAAMALLPVDPEQADFLANQLLRSPIEEFAVVRDAVAPHRDRFIANWWSLVADASADRSHRFHAAMALATYDPDSPNWTLETKQFVVDRLLESSIDYQSHYRAALQPIRHGLIEAVQAAAADSARHSVHRLLAKYALVDFARDRPSILSDALVVSDQWQFPIVLEALKSHRVDAIRLLNQRLATVPAAAWPEDAPQIRNFPDPPRDAVTQIEAALGLVARHFALCQAMPLEQFRSIVETMRPSGFRPVQVRPYEVILARAATDGSKSNHDSAEVLVAAIWKRDGKDWRTDVDLNAEMLRSADDQMANEGFEPVDVAPHQGSRARRYAAVWVRSDSSPPSHRATVDLELSPFELQKKFGLDRSPVVLQQSVDASTGSPRFCGIWRARRVLSTTLGSEQQLLSDSMRFAGVVPIDIGLAQAGEALSNREIFTRQFDEANQVLTGNPDDIFSLRSRGQAAVRLGREHEAVADLKRLFEQTARDVTSQYMFAIALARTGAADAARNELDELRKLSADQDAVRAITAVVETTLGHNESALSALEEAISRRSGDARFLASVASAFALMAHYVEAASNRGAHSSNGDPDLPAQRYKERAIELLNRACDAGYSDIELLASNADLESLRSTAGFRQLLARLGLTRRYTAVWTAPLDEDGIFEGAVNRAADPTSHLARCRELVAAGYRPLSIAATTNAKSPPGHHGGSFSNVAEPRHGGPSSPETGRGINDVVLASGWYRPHLPASRKDQWESGNALASIGLVRLGDADSAWNILRTDGDPGIRTYWIHHAEPMGLDAEEILRRLVQQNDSREQFALLLALGEYDPDRLSEGLRRQIVEYSLATYRDSPRRDLHAASAWLLRRWRLQDRIAEVDRSRADRSGPAHGFEWFINSEGITMVSLPAGEFWMGSAPSDPEAQTSEVRHRVRITRPFAMSDREITVQQFLKFYSQVYGEEYGDIEQVSPRRDNGPIPAVNWFMAAAYCRWLSEQEGVDPDLNCYPTCDEIRNAEELSKTNKPFTLKFPEDLLDRPGYRLPTEAEWEYDCRARTETRFSFGNDQAMLQHFAWFKDNSRREGLPERTWPGGSLKPNDWGLFDMHGNVAEWCWDRPGEYKLDRRDPTGATDGLYRMLRGGSYFNTATLARSAHRVYDSPVNRLPAMGFRIVRAFGRTSDEKTSTAICHPVAQ